MELPIVVRLSFVRGDEEEDERNGVSFRPTARAARMVWYGMGWYGWVGIQRLCVPAEKAFMLVRRGRMESSNQDAR